MCPVFAGPVTYTIITVIIMCNKLVTTCTEIFLMVFSYVYPNGIMVKKQDKFNKYVSLVRFKPLDAWIHFRFLEVSWYKPGK